MAEQVSLAEFQAILERHRLNTPKVQKAIAKRLAGLIAQQAVSNVNDDLLMKRTGTSMRYVGMALKQQNEESNSITIGLPKGDPLAKILRVHDQGGTIYPTHSAMLRIPLPPALTGAGVLKAPLGELGFSIRGATAPGTDKPFFRPKGHDTVGISTGTKYSGESWGTYQPWFLLRAFVVLKARGWFRGAVEFARQNRAREADFVMQKFLKARGEVPDGV